MTSLLFNSLRWGSRLTALAPPTSRALTIRARARPIPDPRGTNLLPPASPDGAVLTWTTESISTPDAFLKAIGRSCDTKLSIESWEDFWRQDGQKLKSAGVGVRDRRYILWCMEKYRTGLPVDEFAHELKPKKIIRGWGPSVQNGKRIRSRRDRSKKKRPQAAVESS
ncbi:hypothetical protein C8R47DRAFT_1143415 [Mycena vitilis]|nr:hypothetical protein C8R47DRAFT_1143415 [Mycena vitilis]